GRHLARHRAGRGCHPHGPQWHGQDHDRALHHGAHACDGRIDPLRRPRDPHAAGLSGRKARHWSGAGRPPGISQSHGAREPDRHGRQSWRRGRAWTLAKGCELFPCLSERLDPMAKLPSGGEQQMLVIGRALMTNPRLLILDEATEGLAPLVRNEIWQCLTRLKAQGLSILVIDKNVDALIRIADRHYLIERGRVVWTGASAALAAAPDVQHRYLGASRHSCPDEPALRPSRRWLAQCPARAGHFVICG